MNIGHDGQVTAAEIQALKSGGFTCARLYYSSWGDPTSRTQGLQLKGAGIDTIMGGWYGTLNQGDLADYDAKVVADAKWAQANGIPQQSLGNEQETNLGNLSVAQWVAHLDVLYPKVAAVYHGRISYEMNSEYLDSYRGVKSPILFGLNLYAGYAYNKAKIQTALSYFSGRAYASETNCDMQYGNDCPTDALHAAEVKGDFMQLVADFPQTRFYYFTMSANGAAAVPSVWGLYTNGSLVEKLTAAALGIK
jgi:hypothetical protein